MNKKSLAYPHLAWMLVFVLVPIGIIFLYSINIWTTSAETGFSLENYKNLFDVTYLKIYGYSLWTAFLSTLFPDSSLPVSSVSLLLFPIFLIPEELEIFQIYA